MGSVLAIAYGIATLDRNVTRDALTGLLLQMAFCLATSTLYFKLSPISTVTPALVDNSSPSIRDLAVALAGGFAGGLGNSREQEAFASTLIAGVAVAAATHASAVRRGLRHRSLGPVAISLCAL